MFSTRVPGDLTPNPLAAALARLKASGEPLIDLTASNPTKAGFAYPPDLLAPLDQPGSLLYSPEPLGMPDARRAIAGDFARRGLTVDPDRIVLAASTSEAYSLLFKILCNAGDEVLIPRPSYPLFEHLTMLDLVAPVAYDLEYQGRWTIDWPSFERALTPRTKAVLLVSPNNPTGHFVAQDDLIRVVESCAARQVAVIADEVFADYELERGAGATSGALTAQTDALAFTLGGLSKTVGLPQAKMAWMAIGGPPALVESAAARLELVCDTYLSVSTFLQVAVGELLKRGAEVRRQIRERVTINYGALQTLANPVSSCEVLRAEGGWYAVLRVPSLMPEEELALRLLTDDRVLAHPGYFFDFPGESFLVVSLLPPPAVFADGLTRILHRFDGRR